MKKFMIYLSILMISNIYAQCDDYSESQCNNDNSCEWVEDIETGNCGNLWDDDCELNPECNWNCDFVDDYMGWCNYSCDGGPYEIDNSYCQEIEMPECSDLLTESNCNHLNECEWVENIETENCYDILDCTGGCTWQECEAIQGCNWHFGTAYYDPSYCYGEHEVDNSYCEETEVLECSGMNESQCNNDNLCEWIIDYEWSTCSNYNSASSCSWANDNGGNCDWSWNSTQWQDTCSGGSFQLDLSYCQENEMPECSDMNESECSYENICEWVENIELVSCNDINSQQECNALGCSWYNGNYYACSICCWGEYEVDNSYCEETEYQLGDLNQDFIINIQDVIIVINLILNGEFDLAADLNLDNAVNVLDVIQIVNIILN